MNFPQSIPLASGTLAITATCRGWLAGLGCWHGLIPEAFGGREAWPSPLTTLIDSQALTGASLVAGALVESQLTPTSLTWSSTHPINGEGAWSLTVI